MDKQSEDYNIKLQCKSLKQNSGQKNIFQRQIQKNEILINNQNWDNSPQIDSEQLADYSCKNSNQNLIRGSVIKREIENYQQQIEQQKLYGLNLLKNNLQKNIEQHENIILTEDINQEVVVEQGIARALQIIDSHERQESEEKFQGGSREFYNEQNFLLTENEKLQAHTSDNFSQSKLNYYSLNFSQSEILGINKNLANLDVIDQYEFLERQIDFYIEDETAQLIEEINNPYGSLQPQNFSFTKKMEWYIQQQQQQQFQNQINILNLQHYEDFQDAIRQNYYGQIQFGPNGPSPQQLAKLQAQFRITYEEKYQFDESSSHKNLYDYNKQYNNNQMINSSCGNQGNTTLINSGNTSNFITFVKIQRNLFGFTILLAPFCIKDYGLFIFSIGICVVCLANSFSCWLVSKSQEQQSRVLFVISNFQDLIKYTFDQNVASYQQLLRILISLGFLMIINIFVGCQANQLMCNSFSIYKCEQISTKSSYQEYIIRIILNFFIFFTIVFQKQLSFKRIEKTLQATQFTLIMTAFAFLFFHYFLIFKTQTYQQKQEITQQFFNHNQTLKNNQSINPLMMQNLSNNQHQQINQLQPGSFEIFKEQIFKLCQFCSLAMCLFEGNQHQLQIKYEMAHPKNFVKVQLISFFAFSAFSFFVGIISYFSLGTIQLQNVYFLVDINTGNKDLFGAKFFQIDIDLILMIKIFCLTAAIINYLIYTMDTFACLDRLISLLTLSQRSQRDFNHQYQIVGNGSQNVLLNSQYIQNYSFNNFQDEFQQQKEISYQLLIIYSSLLTFVIISTNMIQNHFIVNHSNTQTFIILQLCGSIFCTQLVVLIPILIFNKSFRNSGRYSNIQQFNWTLFSITTTFGIIAAYQTIQGKFKSQKL